MDGHRLFRVEYNKVVAVALMVAEKEVLAVLRTVVAPILACYLNRWSLGVFVPRELDAVACEPLKYYIASFHSAK